MIGAKKRTRASSPQPPKPPPSFAHKRLKAEAGVTLSRPAEAQGNEEDAKNQKRGVGSYQRRSPLRRLLARCARQRSPFYSVTRPLDCNGGVGSSDMADSGSENTHPASADLAKLRAQVPILCGELLKSSGGVGVERNKRGRKSGKQVIGDSGAEGIGSCVTALGQKLSRCVDVAVAALTTPDRESGEGRESDDGEAGRESSGLEILDCVVRMLRGSKGESRGRSSDVESNCIEIRCFCKLCHGEGSGVTLSQLNLNALIPLLMDPFTKDLQRLIVALERWSTEFETQPALPTLLMSVKMMSDLLELLSSNDSEGSESTDYPNAGHSPDESIGGREFRHFESAVVGFLDEGGSLVVNFLSRFTLESSLPPEVIPLINALEAVTRVASLIGGLITEDGAPVPPPPPVVPPPSDLVGVPIIAMADPAAPLPLMIEVSSAHVNSLTQQPTPAPPTAPPCILPATPPQAPCLLHAPVAFDMILSKTSTTAAAAGGGSGVMQRLQSPIGLWLAAVRNLVKHDMEVQAALNLSSGPPSAETSSTLCDKTSSSSGSGDNASSSRASSPRSQLRQHQALRHRISMDPHLPRLLCGLQSDVYRKVDSLLAPGGAGADKGVAEMNNLPPVALEKGEVLLAEERGVQGSEDKLESVISDLRFNRCAAVLLDGCFDDEADWSFAASGDEEEGGYPDAESDAESDGTDSEGSGASSVDSDGNVSVEAGVQLGDDETCLVGGNKTNSVLNDGINAVGGAGDASCHPKRTESTTGWLRVYETAMSVVDFCINTVPHHYASSNTDCRVVMGEDVKTLAMESASAILHLTASLLASSSEEGESGTAHLLLLASDARCTNGGGMPGGSCRRAVLRLYSRWADFSAGPVKAMTQLLSPDVAYNRHVLELIEALIHLSTSVIRGLPFYSICSENAQPLEDLLVSIFRFLIDSAKGTPAPSHPDEKKDLMIILDDLRMELIELVADLTAKTQAPSLMKLLLENTLTILELNQPPTVVKTSANTSSGDMGVHFRIALLNALFDLYAEENFNNLLVSLDAIKRLKNILINLRRLKCDSKEAKEELKGSKQNLAAFILYKINKIQQHPSGLVDGNTFKKKEEEEGLLTPMSDD